MRPLLATALITLLLTACGQTGPLYLPKQELPEKQPSEQEQVPAPAGTAAPSGAATTETPAAAEAK